MWRRVLKEAERNGEMFLVKNGPTLGIGRGITGSLSCIGCSVVGMKKRARVLGKKREKILP